MGTRTKVVIAAALCAFSAGTATAATVSAATGDITSRILLKGRIEHGDADKLVAWVRERRIPPSTLEINSPGGSVDEAIRLAQVVSKLALRVRVSSGGVCASACFLVFAAGTGRTGLPAEFMPAQRRRQLQQLAGSFGIPGPVGLHRPYQQGLTSPQNQQGEIMRAVAAYMEQQLIPRRLIDIMMARPSTEIYWLTKDDLRELGEYPPNVEEFLIQKCNYDPRYADKATAPGANFDAVMDKSAKAAECEVAELGAFRLRGVEAVRGGWAPAR